MDVAARLTAAGMSEVESVRKAARVAQLIAQLTHMRGDTGTSVTNPVAFWVPGRIEVLGKHTDYGGGRSLLCAVERGICVTAAARESDTPEEPKVRLLDSNPGEIAEIELSENVAAAPGHWSNYAITVARRIAINFGGRLRGADIVFASDLPPAAGVSSSSALVVAIFLVLSAMNDLPSREEYKANIHTPEDLAGYLGAVENGLDFKSLKGQVGVGTFGGSEDHTAILCSKPNAVAQYSFCPVTFERAIALPAGYTFVIAASGILAEKSGAALEQYNGVSRRLSVGLEEWNRAMGRSDKSMGTAIRSSPDAYDRIRDVLETVTDAPYSARSLSERFDQFHAETIEIIPAAGDALARGDLHAFGVLARQSQLAAELALDNQIRETVALVNFADELGAVAASAFGAGFGGSVWALVESTSVDAFTRGWFNRYKAEFPKSARNSVFFSTLAGPAALRF